MNIALFFAGGMACLGYAMAVSWILRDRIKQQVLALVELARYFKIKAAFYDPGTDVQQQFQQLVQHRQQALIQVQHHVMDLQQVPLRLTHAAAQHQLAGGLLLLRQYGLLLHTDVAALRTAFAGGEVLYALQSLSAAIASDIESVAYAMARNRPIRSSLEWRVEMQVLEGALQSGAGAGGPLAVLRDTIGKMRDVLELLLRLHAATFAGNLRPPAAHTSRLAPFLTRQRYDLRDRVGTALDLAHLPLRGARGAGGDGGVFRGENDAVCRVWLLDCAHCRGDPEAQLQHDTSAPGRPRGRHLHRLHPDRGGLASRASAILLALLFAATAAGPTFLYIKYCYTVLPFPMAEFAEPILQMPVQAPATP